MLRGVDTERNRQSDIVWQDAHTTAFISPKWWPGNRGHVIVIPNAHVENVNEIDGGLLGEVYATAKRIADGLKEAYACSGTSMRQHNEPDGNQDVWHLHVHVFPRYADDRLYERHAESYWPPPEERAEYAERLRHASILRTPGL
jgi:histidine triad (HIT) family protein